MLALVRDCLIIKRCLKGNFEKAQTLIILIIMTGLTQTICNKTKLNSCEWERKWWQVWVYGGSNFMYYGIPEFTAFRGTDCLVE